MPKWLFASAVGFLYLWTLGIRFGRVKLHVFKIELIVAFWPYVAIIFELRK